MLLFSTNKLLTENTLKKEKDRGERLVESKNKIKTKDSTVAMIAKYYGNKQKLEEKKSTVKKLDH